MNATSRSPASFAPLALFTVIVASACAPSAFAAADCSREAWTPAMSCPEGSTIVGRETYSGNPICHTDGYSDVQLNSIVLEAPNLPTGYMLYRVAGGWRVVSFGNRVN